MIRGLNWYRVFADLDNPAMLALQCGVCIGEARATAPIAKDLQVFPSFESVSVQVREHEHVHGNLVRVSKNARKAANR